MAAPSKTKGKTMTDGMPAPKGSANRLCCCPPKARVWIDVISRSIFVENKIEIKRHFETASAAKVVPDITTNSISDSVTRVTATAACNTGVPPQSAGDSVGASKSDSKGDANAKVDADSDGKTVVDEFEFKNQGKVYRTDEYIVHWEADGEAELQVSLDVRGVVVYQASWLPRAGEVKLTKSWLLEPPAYQPGDPEEIVARVTAVDCMGQSATQENRSQRP